MKICLFLIITISHYKYCSNLILNNKYQGYYQIDNSHSFELGVLLTLVIFSTDLAEMI